MEKNNTPRVNEMPIDRNPNFQAVRGRDGTPSCSLRPKFEHRTPPEHASESRNGNMPQRAAGKRSLSNFSPEPTYAAKAISGFGPAFCSNSPDLRMIRSHPFHSRHGDVCLAMLRPLATCCVVHLAYGCIRYSIQLKHSHPGGRMPPFSTP